MWFRIDRFVGDVGRPNDLIADVAIWPANVAHVARLLIVGADSFKSGRGILSEPLDSLLN
jgi:hypothetical protein